MEILVELVLQFAGEVLASVVASIFDGRRPDGAPQPVRLFGFALVAAAFAFGSVTWFPQHVITSVPLQRAWLLVSPLVAALGAWVMHALFFRRDDRVWPMVHAAVFAATITTWRYVALP